MVWTPGLVRGPGELPCLKNPRGTEVCLCLRGLFMRVRPLWFRPRVQANEEKDEWRKRLSSKHWSRLFSLLSLGTLPTELLHEPNLNTANQKPDIRPHWAGGILGTRWLATDWSFGDSYLFLLSKLQFSG